MIKKLLNVFGVAAIGTLLIFSLSGCVDDEELEDSEDTTVVEETGPVRIGGILPLTGDGAAYGLPSQAIAEIARAKVNEEGGINGRQLEIIWEDGKCNGKDAASSAQKLINVDQVKIILGGFCSSETLGVAPIAEQAGVVLLSPGSSSPDVTNAGDYIFRNYPSDASQGKIVANIAADLGLKKIGMLSEENDYTLGIENVFKSTLEERGVELVSESFLPTDTDFRTQITKLKGEGVDGIFINPQTPPKVDLVLKQLQELGTDAQLFGNDVVLGYTEGMSRYSGLVEGMIGAEVSYDGSNPDFIYFSEKYKEDKGEDVPYPMYMATTFDAVNLIKEGVAAGGYNADKFRDWLYTVKNWKGTSGLLTIDSNGDPLMGHVAKVIKDGVGKLYEAAPADKSAEEAVEETTEETTEEKTEA